MKTKILLLIVFISNHIFAQNPQWFSQYNASMGLGIEKNISDKDNNYYYIGYYAGTLDADPSSNQLNFTSMGGLDALVVKFDKDGKLLWAKSFGGLSDDGFKGIDLDANGNVYISGVYSSTIAFQSIGTYLQVVLTIIFLLN